MTSTNLDTASEPLNRLLAEIRGCRICADTLPLGPRPVLRASLTAKVLIAGQAPGTKVHDSGVPWDDASGDRLRDWMAVDKATFYDDSRIAIIPMGFCYPGRHDRGGDLPPRKECAATWHARLLNLLPNIELSLLAGQYAQAYHLGGRRKRNLGLTVRAFREYQPLFMPLPHPSWRTLGWQRKNPWFETDLLPVLRARLDGLL